MLTRDPRTLNPSQQRVLTAALAIKDAGQRVTPHAVGQCVQELAPRTIRKYLYKLRRYGLIPRESESVPVVPCARCGTRGGYAIAGSKRPRRVSPRIDGPWDGRGMLCHSCSKIDRRGLPCAANAAAQAEQERELAARVGAAMAEVDHEIREAARASEVREAARRTRWQPVDRTADLRAIERRAVARRCVEEFDAVMRRIRRGRRGARTTGASGLTNLSMEAG